MARAPTTASHGVAPKSKTLTMPKHLPTKDEATGLAEVIDKAFTWRSRYEQKRNSGNLQNGVIVPNTVCANVGSLVNDLMLAAGEAGIYGLLFKIIMLIKQRADDVKEVDEKAKLVQKHTDQIWSFYERMRTRFACSTSVLDEQKSIITLWEEEVVMLFSECTQVLGQVAAKASNDDVSGCKLWMGNIGRPFKRCFTSAANLQDLNNCIRKLDSFSSELVMEDRARSVNNVLPYLGEKPAVGREFRQAIEDLKLFLKGTSVTDHRTEISVVHIAGPPGAGKSRLAKEILQRIYSEWSKEAEGNEYGENGLRIELLQIDCSTTSGSYLEPLQCQRQLIEQMADGRAAEGLSCKDVGRGKIRNAMKVWKDSITRQKRKVVLSFDNVPTHTSLLSQVLPDDISKSLPAGSCVLISMKGDDIDGKGSGIDVHEQIEAIFSTPRCRHKVYKLQGLEYFDARNLLEEYTKGPPDTDDRTRNDIVHDLVERCEGIPKLLVTFGNFFQTQPRTLSFWYETLKKLEVMDSSAFSEKMLNGFWREHISKAVNDPAAEEIKMFARFTAKLELLFKMKLGECLDAMSDISNVFDGWSWHAVESILGRDILRKLKDRKFISSKHVLLNKDLPLAMRGRQQACTWTDVAVLMNKCDRRSSKQSRVLQADPELRDSARSIFRHNHLHAVKSPMPKQLLDLTKGVSKNLRSLCLVDCEGKFQLRWLDRIQGLHHLILHNIQQTEGITTMTQKDLCYLYWGSMTKNRFPFAPEDLPNLRTLVFTDFDFGAQPKFQIPFQLQNLSLIRCRNVNLIAGSIFESTILKSLHLQECEGICNFTIPTQRKSSIPFDLSIQNCADMERIPPFINKLQRLTNLELISCRNLKTQELESVPKPKQKHDSTPSLKAVTFEDCQSLTCLPAELAPYCKSLTALEIRSCKIKDLSPKIALLENLKELSVASCTSLQTLPTELGDLTYLQTLSLEECRGLRALPPEIGKLQSLKELKLDYCAGLKALPAELEDLKLLTTLSMSFCNVLTPEKQSPRTEEGSRLPDLGKLEHLRYVNIVGLEPPSLHQALASSTDSIRRSSNDRVRLLKDLPKRNNNNRFDLSFCSTPSPRPRVEESRAYKSANN